jgi:hypothetical protein
MTESVAPKRRKASRKGATLSVAYALCFVFAVGASVAVIYTGNDTLMRFGLVFALWAALGWAFIADQSRRKAELVSAKASDYKLIYDLQLEREIAARHHYELSLESELRRQLTAEADSATHSALAELQQQVAFLRGQLQELLDQDLEYDQPALKARATRLDELLVAKQSLGSTESQPRKRAAQAQDEAVSPRLWLPSQPDQARREQYAVPPHGEQQRSAAEQEQPRARRQQPLVQEPPEPAAEQWPHEEQQPAWPQQPESWVQDQQRRQTPWEAPVGPGLQERPAGWQQPKAPPVTGTDPAAEAGQAVDSPSWYSPSEAAPHPVAQPQPEAAGQGPGIGSLQHEQHDVEPPPQSEAVHGKAGKAKHADKADTAKPAESRGGRRAKPVEGGDSPAQERDAEADALAGAHASGHSVNELLSRLTPDEAAGYHGRRRRARAQGAAVSDEDMH